MLGHLYAHQQATVRTAHDAQTSCRGNPARHQILTDGGEVVINALTMSFQSSVMPCGSKLAATADIRKGKHTAAFQPKLADESRVYRRRRDLEATVGCEQCRI